jgi:torulene dioxygenase
MAGVKFAWNESILDSFTFQHAEPTLFYVISREGQQHVATYRADACFA